MPFPFMPYGFLFGIAFLAAVLAVFGLALEIVNRAFTEARVSIGPGLVAGVQAWVRAREEPPLVSPTASAASPPRSARVALVPEMALAIIEDLPEPPAIETEYARRGRG